MDSRRRFLLFIYSTPNIVGALLGLFGLVLFFTGVIGRFWILIVIGLYFIGVLATPKSEVYNLKIQNQLSAEEIRDELENLMRKIRGKAPKEILAKVEGIKDSILQVLPQLVDLSSSDRDIYVIRQTALEYLPETLQNYLNLPRAYANVHPIKDGKTARQLLGEQLDILDREMKEIVEDIYKSDSQRLMVHGRFLEDKFGKSSELISGSG
jgi:hypothetical protein